MDKYSALKLTATVCQFMGILIGIVGIIFSLWLIFGHPASSMRWVVDFKIWLGIAGVLASIVWAVLIYAVGDFLYCLMGIEYNTRQK